MGNLLFLLGILSLIIGCGLRYWINRNRFYRRNQSGLQEFESYESAVGTSCLEKIGRLFGFTLIVLGILLLWYWLFKK